MWAAASDFGQKINNSHKLYKKTTMASVISAAVKKINDVGYIYAPNTPNDEVHIRLWFICTRQINMDHDSDFKS